MIDRVKFGIIGFGHIGRRHAKCIMQNDRAELIGVCDILSLDELNTNDFSDLTVVSSLKILLNMDIDVINICTPNYLHAEMAADCLNSGKHVVIEKPMTLNSEDARSIIKISNDVNKLVFCVMQNRFSPTMIWLKDVISRNLLGNIKMVSVNCFWNRNKNFYVTLLLWSGRYIIINDFRIKLDLN